MWSLPCKGRSARSSPTTSAGSSWPSSLNGVGLDALVAELGSSRNAIYKTLFDARRKLRAALVTHGYLDNDVSRQA